MPLDHIWGGVKNVVMKAIKIAELKTHLSRYLKLVRNGERLVVFDRNEAIAEIVPLRPDDNSVFARLARQGRLKLGSQDRSKLRFPKMKKLPVEAALLAGQADLL